MLVRERETTGRPTGLVLAHRRSVVVVWLPLAVVGGALAPRTIDRRTPPWCAGC
jgi:RND superfamily putative drug exporter